MPEQEFIAENSPAIASRLALERTRIAYERTLMAWVRTAMSLITFGFTVYKVFEFELSPPKIVDAGLSPREFGMILIVIGTMALIVGKIEHRRDLAMLKEMYPGMPLSGTRLISWLVAALGILALGAVILRM